MAAVRSKRPTSIYPSCGLFIARDERFVVAVKAGDNGDGHKHNDVGSVTVYKDGRPLLIDVGVETYTAKTFSPERYEIWTMQSAFHNLPSFAGVQQRAGEAFAASDVVVDLERAVASISMDIAGAYPPEGGGFATIGARSACSKACPSRLPITMTAGGRANSR